MTNIPPAPARRRQITHNIHTSSRGTVGVMARYSGPRATITCTAHDEVLALIMLLESLSVEPTLALLEFAAACDVTAALQAATPATPWEQQPLGLRGSKPKRARYKWTITLPDGKKKQVHIYKDTLRPHRDPNCKCPICTAMNANPPHITEEDQEQ